MGYLTPSVILRGSKSTGTTDKLTSGTVSFAIAPTGTGIAAGSTLLLFGANEHDTSDSVLYPKNTAMELLAVSDGVNTWEVLWNTRPNSQVHNGFCAIARNVAALPAGQTLTLTLSLDDTNTQTSGGAEIRNRFSACVVEVTNVRATHYAPNGEPVTFSPTTKGSGDAYTVTPFGQTTGALAQPNCVSVVFACGAGGTGTDLAGWGTTTDSVRGTNYADVYEVPHAAGEQRMGLLVTTQLTETTEGFQVTVNHASTLQTSANVVILQAKEDAPTLVYRFELDPSSFDSSDSGITAYVWRGGDPDQVLAEVFTNRSGSAAAGVFELPAAVGAEIGQSVKAVLFNNNDTSGLITGSVVSL